VAHEKCHHVRGAAEAEDDRVRGGLARAARLVAIEQRADGDGKEDPGRTSPPCRSCPPLRRPRACERDPPRSRSGAWCRTASRTSVDRLEQRERLPVHVVDRGAGKEERADVPAEATGGWTCPRGWHGGENGSPIRRPHQCWAVCPAAGVQTGAILAITAVISLVRLASPSPLHHRCALGHTRRPSSTSLAR
jgi:hypothetical protein